MEKRTYTKQEVIELVNEFKEKSVNDIKLTPEKFLSERGFVNVNPGEFWIIDDKLRKVTVVEGSTIYYISMNGEEGVFTSDCIAIKTNKLRQATPREINFFLIEEAIRRGFSDGVSYVSPVGKYNRVVSGDIKVNSSYDVYDNNGHLLYSNSVSKWGVVTE